MEDIRRLPGPDLSSMTFDSLIVMLRSGSELAAQQLLERFEPHVVRVIRKRMNAQLRGRFDSQDFTQAVWASFFGNLPRVSQFADSDALVKFLSRVAANKVIDAGRRAQVRNEHQSDEHLEGIEASRDLRLNLSEPTPSQHAMAGETWDQLIRNEDESDRRVLELRRQGLTQLEISVQLGISERQVRRILSRMSRKMLLE
jgi:RNA polymerase sigma factor (sigma-70 family)